MDDTLERWLDKEIVDAENVVGMYRSYRRGDSLEALVLAARLQALEDVRFKLQELWGLPPRA